MWPLTGRTDCSARFLTARLHTFNCHVPRNYIVAGLSAGRQLAPLALRTVCVHGAGFSLRLEPLRRPAIYSLAFALLGMSSACVTVPELIPLHLPHSNYIVAAIVSRSSHRRATHYRKSVSSRLIARLLSRGFNSLSSKPRPPFPVEFVNDLGGFPYRQEHCTPSLYHCQPLIWYINTGGRGRGGRLCRSQLIGNVGECRLADHNWCRMIGNAGARVRLCNVRGVYGQG